MFASADDGRLELIVYKNLVPDKFAGLKGGKHSMQEKNN
jgi:hypothetical protein